MLKVDPFYVPFPPVGEPMEGMPDEEQMRRSFDFLQRYRDALGDDLAARAKLGPCEALLGTGEPDSTERRRKRRLRNR